MNGYCIEQAVRTGLGLQGRRSTAVSVFERKNYFYPDLPSGYQISQYQHPIVGTGTLTIDLPDGTAKEIGITRLHLEMDAGKSLHDQRDADDSLIDLNRSGVALMEIVSEPDIRSPEEAVLYLRKLRSILRYLGTCDGNMEEGSLRCDANVSVRRVGDDGARHALRDQERQLDALRRPGHRVRGQAPGRDPGGRRHGSTRRPACSTPARGETRSMRSQGGGARLPLLPRPRPPAARARGGPASSGSRAGLPELPDDKKARFVRDYGLSPYDAGVLVAEARHGRLLRGRWPGAATPSRPPTG